MMQLVCKIKPLSGGLRKKFGGPKRPAQTALEDGCNGENVFHFSSPFCPIFFAFFKKKSKQAILFHNFLHEKCIDRKKRVHYDEEHGKTKKMAVSDFSVDPQKVV